MEQYGPDGYPTEELLETIRKWSGDFNELLSIIHDSWRYAKAGFWAEKDIEAGIPNVWDSARREYQISTAGWSGNESLIEALRANTGFWFMCWLQERKGGHYIFEVREEHKHDLPKNN